MSRCVNIKDSVFIINNHVQVLLRFDSGKSWAAEFKPKLSKTFWSVFGIRWLDFVFLGFSQENLFYFLYFKPKKLKAFCKPFKNKMCKVRKYNIIMLCKIKTSEQAQLGVPHSEIQVELDWQFDWGQVRLKKSPSVAGTCQIFNFA